LPVRPWWSCKTLLLDPALEWWKNHGQGVEVVSELELERALDAGFSVDAILINGPAKHTWLPRQAMSGLRVNFDSLREIQRLAPVARRRHWRVGIRINTAGEVNAELPGVRSQFGLLPEELPAASRVVARNGLVVEVAHFHLRTNVPRVALYREAIREVMGSLRANGWAPGVLDTGGGFPVARVRDRRGRAPDAAFSLEEMRGTVQDTLREYPHLREIWMENGRWLSAPGAVLAIRVLDVKEGRGARTLICDGGRTLHALVATWERHSLLPLKPRRGPAVPTVVYGPTCMAFDNLGCHALPRGIREGDVLLWFDAGAYQLSWATRFSHGPAAVVWCASGRRTFGTRVCA
jgi:diaminopimelate decarboxylase